MATPFKTVNEELAKGRRGDLDQPLSFHARSTLISIMQELGHIQDKAELIGDDFLAHLIGSAADEARDRLRDDLVLKEELKRAENGSPPA